MAGEQAKARAVGRLTEDDLPYAGVLGRTRSEAVQVLMPDGSIRSLAVFTGIDAVADPALAALARAGTLHHVAEGVELALPFTYHDPLARVFVLVLPEGLRHRALGVRGELMLALAGDTGHAVPDYVRDIEVVVGPRGLSRRLEQRTPPLVARDLDGAHAESLKALAERERELARRERLLDARERALQVPMPARHLAAVHESDVEEIDDQDGEVYEAIEAREDDDDGTPAERVSVALEEVEDLDAGEVLLEGGDSANDTSVVPAVLESDVAPPDAFASDPALQLSLAEGDGRVWLFLRGRPAARRASAQMELLIQVDPRLEPPVVLVTFVFDVDGSPEVRRGVIDPFVPAQRDALVLLAQHFEVELVSASSQGMEHFATLHTPREGNVRAIVDHLDRYGDIDRARWEDARESLLASPPPWRDRSHPFQSGASYEPPVTATEAAVLLDELSEWLVPERRARLRLALCVPDEIIDDTYRAGIGYALDWGLSLSRELATRALELGMAKDEAALLVRRIDGLCRTSRESDLGGLEEGVLRAQWSDALEQAARLGVTLSEDARTLAQQHAGERALVHANALSDSLDASLDGAREKARAEPPDLGALRELAERGGYRDVLEACRAAQRLEPGAMGELFARVARRNDPVAVDALLTLLAVSEEQLVRAGAALALASRRAVNALEDLVAHVGREPDPEYRLFALALGRYGAGGFRAIARALKTQDVEDERVALVFAHLALHGARAQVRAKARSRERREAQLAERALALASQLKDGKKPALGLEQQGALTVFCEMFDRFCRDEVG